MRILRLYAQNLSYCWGYWNQFCLWSMHDTSNTSSKRWKICSACMARSINVLAWEQSCQDHLQSHIQTISLFWQCSNLVCLGNNALFNLVKDKRQVGLLLQNNVTTPQKTYLPRFSLHINSQQINERKKWQQKLSHLSLLKAQNAKLPGGLHQTIPKHWVAKPYLLHCPTTFFYYIPTLRLHCLNLPAHSCMKTTYDFRMQAFRDL